MKNTFKKLTALAMSFALLGAGSAISKAIAPKSVNTLTASAISPDEGKGLIHFLLNFLPGGSAAKPVFDIYIDTMANQHKGYHTIMEQVGLN